MMVHRRLRWSELAHAALAFDKENAPAVGQDDEIELAKRPVRPFRHRPVQRNPATATALVE